MLCKNILKSKYSSRNNDFYIGENGFEIMDTSNFSKEVIRYLNYEQAFISKTLVKYKYGTLIELGCDEVRLHGTSIMNEVKYIGVYIREDLQSSASEQFLVDHHVESQFIPSCLSDFHELINIDTRGSVLTVFPFNLIGNLDGYKSQIEKCFLSGFDIIISQFNTTDKAKVVRHEYYKKCGLSNLTLEETDKGDCFKDVDFESWSYRKRYIVDLCESVGYRCTDSYESKLLSICSFSCIEKRI